MPGVLKACSDDSVRHRRKVGMMRMFSLPQGFRGSILSIGLRVVWAKDRDLCPALEGALHLLRGGDAEDVLQLVVHPVHLV
jgi:hypothetical protein